MNRNRTFNEKKIMNIERTTSGYILLFRGTHWEKRLSPEESQKVMSQWTAWFERLTQQGKATACHPLGREITIVSGRKEQTVIKSPLNESKAAIAGLVALQVNDLKAAVEIVKECPVLKYGATIEIRPVLDPSPTRLPADEQFAQATKASRKKMKIL
jgi:hypothetical protein